MELRRFCVFCGSRPGARPEYLRAARELGQALVHRGLGLVYGGASVGMMGELADAVLQAGGNVVGVIPQGLVDRELAHAGLSELRVVASMHERKALMERLSHGFVALPGGFGTFEELLEIITWAQLGLHDKPIGVLDVAGYYAPLRRQVELGVREGFIRPDLPDRILLEDSPAELVARMLAFRPSPPPRRWIGREES
jgi:uncharacterized protein (TIGR00730 family)